ncbi:MAG: hypothetical protein GTO41_23965 [Burkholderiales bacterium]|nr:hypothetical protein [Burkholderiales bacterium]
MYGDAYVSYADVLVLVMLAAAIEFIGSLLGVALTAMNELRVHQYIFAVSVVAMVVTGLLLIPSGQLHGAAWCIVLASTIRLSLSLCAITYAWRRFPKKSTV